MEEHVASGILLIYQSRQKTSGGYKWLYIEDYEGRIGKLVHD